MIGKTSRGQSFSKLGQYLTAGHKAGGPDRVAWSRTRNLASADPALAPSLMTATASLSKRVKKPVYHLILSFAPEDDPTPKKMERAADTLIDALGLSEHEALMVAHNDTLDDTKGEGCGHEHVHMMINRVHPETGKAWAGRHDWRCIMNSLRKQELDFGFRELQTPPMGAERKPHRKPDREAGLARRQAEGAVFSGSPDVASGLARMSRERAKELREDLSGLLSETSSWGDLEARLERRSLELRSKGNDLIIIRGGYYAKLSDLMPPKRKVSDLTKRFGRYADHLKKRQRLKPDEKPRNQTVRTRADIDDDLLPRRRRSVRRAL